MSLSPINKIAVFGDGLAGLFAVAKLAEILPDGIQLIFVESQETRQTDILFGTVTPPSTYDFLLGLGIQEPKVLTSTNTSFSLGTHYKKWGPDKRNWIQSFHRPLPVYNGVAFHHYLMRLEQVSPGNSELESYIMSVQAARRGVFAHPPEAKNIPLADVAYGYHFLPEQWCQIVSAKISDSNIERIKSDITSVARHGDKIDSVTLSNGQIIAADFFVNALGAMSKLTHPDAESLGATKVMRADNMFTAYEKIEGVCRVLTGTESGWTSTTPLQDGLDHLSITDLSAEAENSAGKNGQRSIEFSPCRLKKPWLGNCLVLGHGAAIIEPLTTAPILLLQRDIERLVELIPVSNDMRVESREYNRRFNDDYDHADLFTGAFFAAKSDSQSAYWNSPTVDCSNLKLLNKITQFESRGINVQYDYEPFSAEDWTMLHFGMGRSTERYDPLANSISEDLLNDRLSQMRTAIEIMARKMPPHHIYMAGLKKYLKDKHG